MKSKIYKGAMMLFALACLSSCDVLDLEPLDSYTETTIFSDATLTEAYVTKFYTYPRVAINDMGHRIYCDEARNNFGSNSTWSIMQAGMTPDDSGWLNSWKEYYKNIKNINIFFDNMGNVEKIPEPDRSILIGEATFFRAFFYMDLISHYGGVPLITRTFELDDTEMMMARNSYEECADFCVEEFEKAASLLPEKQTGKNFGRLTKGAALAYKARMLLYMASPLNNPGDDRSKWEAASKACEEVFALNRYTLDPDYQGLFYNPQSSEIIFERLYDTEHGHWCNWYNRTNGSGGWSATNVTQEMVDSYENEDGTMPDPTPYLDENNPSPVCPWLNRDPRFYANIVIDGSMFGNREIEFWINEDGKTGGLDSEFSSIENWNYSKSHYTMRKFTDESISQPRATRANNPWIFCRLAEVYLNYAEAQYHLGNEAKAREYVNKIRERARGGKAGILPDVTESGEALLKKIQHERKVELAFEEHRWYDVRRWKIAAETQSGQFHGMRITRKADGTKVYNYMNLEKRAWDDSQYLLPIPSTEINKNNLLKQNPGY